MCIYTHPRVQIIHPDVFTCYLIPYHLLHNYRWRWKYVHSQIAYIITVYGSG